MTSTSYQAWDSRARRAAKSCGLVARKCRRRHPLDNRGGFILVDPSTGFPVVGFYYDLNAEGVIDYCAQFAR